jgi:hypothetical protein
LWPRGWPLGGGPGVGRRWRWAGLRRRVTVAGAVSEELAHHAVQVVDGNADPRRGTHYAPYLNAPLISIYL